MKPTAICSIVVLSLAALSLKTEAASAPEGAHSFVADVKSPTSEHPAAKHALSVVAGNDPHVVVVGRNISADSASQAGTFTAGGRVLSAKEAARFNKDTATASKSFSQEMNPVKTWAANMNAASDEVATAQGDITGKRLKALRKMVKATLTIVRSSEGKIAALVIAHDATTAGYLCEGIRKDALDVKAVRLQFAGYTKKSDLALKRAHMIKMASSENERVVSFRLQRIVDIANHYTAEFKSYRTAAPVPAI